MKYLKKLKQLTLFRKMVKLFFISEDFSLLDDFLKRDGGTGETVQEPQPCRPMGRAEALQEKDSKKRLRIQQETQFREESDLELETGSR